MIVTATQSSNFIAACLAKVDGIAAEVAKEVAADARREFGVNMQLLRLAEAELTAARFRLSLALDGVFDVEPAQRVERDAESAFVHAFEALFATPAPMCAALVEKRRYLKQYRMTGPIAPLAEECERHLEADEERLRSRRRK